MGTRPATAERTDFDTQALRDADVTAVLAGLATGTPLDPEVMERVRARAERVSEHVRQVHGLVDDDTFQSLLDDEA